MPPLTWSGDAGITGEPASSVTEITGEQAIVINAPEAGEAPQDTIAAGEGYTGSVTWDPADASFGYEKAYTANVVLTAAATHKFAAGATATVAGATVTGNTISADAAGNTLTFAAAFPATAGDPVMAELNAALAKVVPGTVSVAFGADQTAKTAAVKTYAENLVADAAITTTVEYVSGSDYKVTLTKGGKSVNKTITMTVTESADPDIAIVGGVKSAIEGHTFSAVAQSAITDAAAAKAALQAQVNALTLNDVTATVNEGTYVPSVAGDAGKPAGTPGSYKATVALNKGAVNETTTEIALVITANPYVAPDQTPVPVFTSAVDTLTSESDTDATFTVSNASAYTGAVTVAVYTDAGAQNAANGVTGSYADGTLTLNGVAAGDYYVTFTEDGKAVSSLAVKVTVKAYVAPVAPPVPSAPDADTTVEAPAQTTGQTSYEYSYKSVAEGTPMGKVALSRVDGASFDLNDPAAANIQYKMVAAAEAGHKFVKWATKGRTVSITGDTIIGTESELAAYSAMFAQVSTSAPKLDQMTLTTADGLSTLLHKDGVNRGFASDVLEYNVNLMPGATGFDLSMVIETMKDAAMDTELKVGENVVTPTKVTVNNSDIYTFTYTANVAADGPVIVTLTNGAEVTTYTLNAAIMTAKPQIVMDVEDKTGGAYDLKVSLENTLASTFSFRLHLDATVFAGFTKADMTELSAADIMTELNAMLAADSAFEVVKATYDVDVNDLYVTLATTDSSFIDCTAKTPVMTLKFKTVSGSSATMEDLKKLTIESTNKQNSSLTDSRLNPMTENTADGKTGLILINLPNEMTIVGYLNTVMDMDTQAAKAVISIKNDKGEVVATGEFDTASRRFTAQVSQGETYTLEIVLPNFVKNNKLTITGTADAIVGAVTLLAGDLDNNDLVNTDDRALLIAELYKTVEAGSIGDIDGNGEVNGVDLGYLLAGMGVKK